MTIEQIKSDKVTEPAPGLWSNCLKVDNLVFISGLTARSMDLAPAGGDEYQQAKLIFERMKALVEAAGGGMGDIVKLTIFVTNIANREQVWAARREAFSGAFPACSLVEVRNLAPGVSVEIEGIAVLGKGGRPAG